MNVVSVMAKYSARQVHNFSIKPFVRMVEMTIVQVTVLPKFESTVTSRAWHIF